MLASNDVILLYPFETSDKMGIAVPKPTKKTFCQSYLCFQDASRSFSCPPRGGMIESTPIRGVSAAGFLG